MKASCELDLEVYLAAEAYDAVGAGEVVAGLVAGAVKGIGVGGHLVVVGVVGLEVGG